MQTDKETWANEVAALAKDQLAAQAETLRLRKATDILTWAVLNEEAEGAGTAKLLKAALGNVQVICDPRCGTAALMAENAYRPGICLNGMCKRR